MWHDIMRASTAVLGRMLGAQGAGCPEGVSLLRQQGGVKQNPRIHVRGFVNFRVTKWGFGVSGELAACSVTLANHKGSANSNL